MPRSLTFVLPCLIIPLFAAADWLQFRGSENSSIAAGAKLPTRICESENIAWKVPLPGNGVSGPIVVGERVYVTASSGPVVQDRLQVLCFDTNTGNQLWKREFWATGRCFHHPTSANAAPTPASDGERIFAFYSSNDLACLDLAGNLLWYRGLASDYPKAGNDVGMASSPLVIGKTVVVQIENQGDSFAAGIDTETGETRWRVERKPGANWCSPTALRGADGKDLVLLQSSDGLSAHDPLTGEQVWKYKISCSGIPSTTTVGDKIYLPAKGLTVLTATPESTEPELAWDSNRLSPGNASPIILGDKVYVLPKGGVLTCGSADNGDLLWQLRLKGTFWATPVVAGEHMYCVNQDGQCLVVNLAGEKGELVATADLGERFLASPAASSDALYLRGDKHLWKIAEKP
jgi:outer membrane protein assembly factor BamB